MEYDNVDENCVAMVCKARERERERGRELKKVKPVNLRNKFRNVLIKASVCSGSGCTIPGSLAKEINKN